MGMVLVGTNEFICRDARSLKVLNLYLPDAAVIGNPMRGNPDK